MNFWAAYFSLLTFIVFSFFSVTKVFKCKTSLSFILRLIASSYSIYWTGPSLTIFLLLALIVGWNGANSAYYVFSFSLKANNRSKTVALSLLYFRFEYALIFGLYVPFYFFSYIFFFSYSHFYFTFCVWAYWFSKNWLKFLFGAFVSFTFGLNVHYLNTFSFCSS